MEPNSAEYEKQLTERFASLPKVVQDAITSADVQKHMRDLAETHKLHIDQWQVLENNVMLTLLGFQPVAELPHHLQKDLSITPELATELTNSISNIVFAPIRGELEQMLDHPTAVQQAESALESVTAAALTEEARVGSQDATASAEPPPAAPPADATPKGGVAPATPPPPAPVQKADRGSISSSYISAPSHERKTIEGDPYREQLN